MKLAECKSKASTIPRASFPLFVPGYFNLDAPAPPLSRDPKGEEGSTGQLLEADVQTKRFDLSLNHTYFKGQSRYFYQNPFLMQVCGSAQIPVPRAQYTVSAQQQNVALGQGPLHLHVAEVNARVFL